MPKGKPNLHITRVEIDDGEGQQSTSHPEIKYIPFTRYYFCGKFHRFLREEPEPIQTEAQKLEVKKLIENEEKNPSKVCPKCKVMRLKSKEYKKLLESKKLI
jgi:hypothetical protein